MSVTFPIDFDLIRKTVANAVKTATTLTCVLEEPKEQNFPRPVLPYFSFKLTTPAAKEGDDSLEYVSGTTYNRGGQRQMTISFNCYSVTAEESYKYMALWQSSLETDTVQEILRAKGIAIWLVGGVADLSKLLNTGYEGRAQMDVTFGIASNIVEDLGRISQVEIEGTVEADGDEITQTFTVKES